VSYNPLFAGELFFFDSKTKTWISASNVDPEVLRICASFAEAKEYRVLQEKYKAQAELNHHRHQRQRTPEVKQTIRDATAEKNLLPAQPTGSKLQMRENRTAEKARFRSAGLNGALPVQSPAANPPANDEQHATATPSGSTPSEPGGPPRANEPTAAEKFKSLWSKVNAVSK
jgi:hypothetical protein